MTEATFGGSCFWHVEATVYRAEESHQRYCERRGIVGPPLKL
jgi:peptide methionine sulfoxide reductase MsrA